MLAAAPGQLTGCRSPDGTVGTGGAAGVLAAGDDAAGAVAVDDEGLVAATVVTESELDDPAAAVAVEPAPPPSEEETLSSSPQATASSKSAARPTRTARWFTDTTRYDSTQARPNGVTGSSVAIAFLAPAVAGDGSMAITNADLPAPLDGVVVPVGPVVDVTLTGTTLTAPIGVTLPITDPSALDPYVGPDGERIPAGADLVIGHSRVTRGSCSIRRSTSRR